VIDRARNDEIDRVVELAIGNIGGATTVGAIDLTACCYTELLVYRPDVSNSLRRVARRGRRQDVSNSLRRLARRGRVGLHDGHGQMATWRNGNRCIFWSTAKTLFDTYGYLWIGRWEHAVVVSELLREHDVAVWDWFDTYAAENGMRQSELREIILSKAPGEWFLLKDER